jgi:hypothetical protein
MTIPADALSQHFLITAERRFWRCVQTGEIPRPQGIEAPGPRVEALRIVDMKGSNSWAEAWPVFCATRWASLTTSAPNPNSRRSCRRTLKKQPAMAFAEGDRSRARSASVLDRGTAMHRSGEIIKAMPRSLRRCLSS